MIAAGRRSRGLSLIELLVAMTLGLLLLSGMISVFASNRQSSALNAAVADMQESARYALDTLAADIRSAGFQGCLGVQSGSTVVQAKDAPTTRYLESAATGSAIGADGLWSPAPPPGFVPANHDAVPGTHAIALQFGDAATRLLAGQMLSGGTPSPTGTIRLTKPLEGASDGDLAIISNCEKADIFRITRVNAAGDELEHKVSGNLSGSLSTAYGNEMTLGQTAVMLFRSNVYYVGDTGQTNGQGDPIRALYQQTLPYGDPDANPPTELVSGVENLRVAFGVRQAGDNLRYVPPDSPEFDPERVEALQVGLLMASEDRIGFREDTRTYALAGQPVPAGDSELAGATHAADRRHRLVFNTTVKIRNRRFRP